MSMKKSGPAASRRHVRRAQHELGRAGRRDDDVDVAETRRGILERQRLTAEAVRELACRCRPVRFATYAIRAPREARFAAASSPIRPAPISSTRRPVRSPNTCAASAAAAEETDAGALADRGLRPDPLADGQRLAEHPVEQRPGRSGLEGGAHLAEDLALAGHERVEARRDPEEVQRRRLVVQAVEDAVERLAGELLERREHRVLVDAVDVQLGAVARREADGVAERPRERSAASRSSVTRSRSSTGATWCERPTSESLMRSGSARGPAGRPRSRARSRRARGRRRGGPSGATTKPP